MSWLARLSPVADLVVSVKIAFAMFAFVCGSNQFL